MQVFEEDGVITSGDEHTDVSRENGPDSKSRLQTQRLYQFQTIQYPSISDRFLSSRFNRETTYQIVHIVHPDLPITLGPSGDDITSMVVRIGYSTHGFYPTTHFCLLSQDRK